MTDIRSANRTEFCVMPYSALLMQIDPRRSTSEPRARFNDDNFRRSSETEYYWSSAISLSRYEMTCHLSYVMCHFNYVFRSSIVQNYSPQTEIEFWLNVHCCVNQEFRFLQQLRHVTYSRYRLEILCFNTELSVIHMFCLKCLKAGKVEM